MKQMNANVFLDSNIIEYSYSNSEIDKQKIARKLITESNSYISTQVLQELSNIVTRKFKFSYQQAILAIKECCQNNNLYVNTENTVLQACQVADRYGFSFYDSLIIAAALESGCTILYSEDLQNGQLIDEKLTIKNPFNQ
ncbi:PIN domain-containing protein [Chitinophaga sp.]|uniref:PIN domain-containing protein n=1 Tax=Chitinophaga sp. TaxID=1869181 RepID=UPI002F920C42